MEYSSDDLARISAQLDEWQRNPEKYVREVLGVSALWDLQVKALQACPRAIAEHKIMYIASGHALGKDFISSCIGLWFLQTYRPSVVLETAPTERQTKSIMWKETTARWEGRLIDLGGTIYKEPRLEIAPDWYMLGFTTKETGATKEGGGGKFQGYHEQNICVIATEAQAIPDEIYDQIDGVATSQNCLVVLIGNPTRARGRFAQGLKDKVNNIVFNFSCLENPNYIEKRMVIPGLASYEWVEDKRRKWGESDPRWIGRVLGQVPDNALSNTFPQSWINHCRERFGFLSRHDPTAGVAVDSAGEGIDENVIMSGVGGEVDSVYTKTLMTPTEVALKAVEMCRQVNGSFIVFDCDGVGVRDYQEACSLPSEFLGGIQLIKFHGSAPSSVCETLPNGKKRSIYANLRAEAAFVTRDRGFSGKCSINERDTELIEDLVEEEFFENKAGVIQIEPKEDIKERLERSPGRGDAYKMLQWGFEQRFEDNTYEGVSSRNKFPSYGVTDEDINFVRMTDGRRMPRYARTD